MYHCFYFYEIMPNKQTSILKPTQTGLRVMLSLEVQELSPLPGWCSRPGGSPVHRTWCWWCSHQRTVAWSRCWRCRHCCQWCRCRCRCHLDCGYGMSPYRCRPVQHRRWWQFPCWREHISQHPLQQTIQHNKLFSSTEKYFHWDIDLVPYSLIN